MKNKAPVTNIRVTLIFFVLIFQFLHLSAQVQLSDSLVKERIQCIQKMLDEGKKNANLWWNGWLVGYGALTVGQGAVSLMSTDENTKIEWAFGSFTSLIGVASQVFMPMVPGYAPDRLALITENNKEEEIKKLNIAEDLLKLSVLREKTGRSWKMHALCGIVNVGVELIYCYGFNQPGGTAIRYFAINTAISEAQIWTQPTKAMKDYKNYCKKYRPIENLGIYKQKPEWHVGVYPGGITACLVF